MWQGVTFPFLDGGSCDAVKFKPRNRVLCPLAAFACAARSDPRAARDTYAPRALLRRLISRNPLTVQGLQFRPARGARPQRRATIVKRFFIFTCIHWFFPPSALKEPRTKKVVRTRCTKSKIHRYLHSTKESTASRIPYILRTYKFGRFCFLSIRARGVRGGRSVGKRPRAATWKTRSIAAPATQWLTDRDKKLRGVRLTPQCCHDHKNPARSSRTAYFL